MSAKMGRPVIGNIKNNDIKVRVDDITHKKLIQYAEKHNITKAEAVRQGINLLLEEK